MALIVQTNAGLSTADSYQSIVELDAYAEARGWADWVSADDERKEAAAREATIYLDTVARYKGVRLTADQSTEFPREGLVDWSGYTIAGVPGRVKRAHSLLALRALNEGLYVDLDRGGQIVSESVAGISVSYRPDAPIGKTFREAMQLLSQYVRDVMDLDMPHPGGVSGDPIFSIGMHDGEGGQGGLE